MGNRIQERREELGWSRAQLARKLGVRRMTVWRLENGVTQPGLAKLNKVARKLRTTVVELLA